MEILSFLKPKKKKQFFVSENDLKANPDKQFRLSIESLASLWDSEVEEEDDLEIDYFFYADTLQKIQKLETELQEIKMMHETLR